MALDFSHLMTLALSEAEKGLKKGEVPVGAVLCSATGEILAKAHNQPVLRHDPTAHAEILVLREAGIRYSNYRLTGTTLVVTLEPCLMCMGAAVHARVSRLVFGAYDPKAGAAGSLYNLARDERLNHRIEVFPGILEQSCAELIRAFFRDRRRQQKNTRRGTEVVVTGSTRNRLVPLEAGHVGSNPTLSAIKI